MVLERKKLILPGDPQFWTPEQVNKLHSYDDVDRHQHSHHHTLGSSPLQAAPGNHSHTDEEWTTVSGLFRWKDSVNNAFTLNSNSWFQYQLTAVAIKFRFRLIIAAVHNGHTGFKIESDITAQNPNGTDGPAGWAAFGRALGGSRLCWLDIPDGEDHLYIYDPATGSQLGADLSSGDYLYGEGFYTITASDT